MLKVWYWITNSCDHVWGRLFPPFSAFFRYLWFFLFGRGFLGFFWPHLHIYCFTCWAHILSVRLVWIYGYRFWHSQEPQSQIKLLIPLTVTMFPFTVLQWFLSLKFMSCNKCVSFWIVTQLYFYWDFFVGVFIYYKEKFSWFGVKTKFICAYKNKYIKYS